jgi:hypothetical protein
MKYIITERQLNLIESHIPSVYDRRRMETMEMIVKDTMDLSRPCDYGYVIDYIESLIYVVKTIVEFQYKEITQSDVSRLIKKYFVGMIDNYFMENTKNC